MIIYTKYLKVKKSNRVGVKYLTITFSHWRKDAKNLASEKVTAKIFALGKCAAKIFTLGKCAEKIFALGNFNAKIFASGNVNEKIFASGNVNAKFLFNFVQLPSIDHNFLVSAPNCTPFEALDS